MAFPLQGERVAGVQPEPTRRDPASARGHAPAMPGKRPADPAATTPAESEDSAESQETPSSGPYTRGSLINIKA